MKPLGWAIAVSALFITVPRYNEVFAAIDNTPLTAFGMGVLLAGGAAYIFHTWARTKRQNAWMLLAAFAVNLAYEPVIITPFVLARLHDIPLAASMSHGYSVFWSLVVAAAPVVLVAGVVLAISFQKETRAKRAETTTESSKAVSETDERIPCPVCGRLCKGQNGLNGHMRVHRTKGE